MLVVFDGVGQELAVDLCNLRAVEGFGCVGDDPGFRGSWYTRPPVVVANSAAV